MPEVYIVNDEISLKVKIRILETLSPWACHHIVFQYFLIRLVMIRVNMTFLVLCNKTCQHSQDFHKSCLIASTQPMHDVIKSVMDRTPIRNAQ
jgi:hypothetical protein